MSKTIIITGAGTGLGRSIARTLAARGDIIGVLGRRLDKVEAVAKALGGGSFAVACDVGDPASVDATFATIAKRAPKIDVLINNAGVFDRAFLSEATNEQIATALNTNLAGPIYCARAVVPLMQRGGHIINVSTETVEINMGMLGLYQASKAGMERFSQTLNQELEPVGIRSTIVRASKMIEPDIDMSGFDPVVGQRFYQENLRVGFDISKSALSQYESVAQMMPWLIDMPEDLHIPLVTLAARKP